MCWASRSFHVAVYSGAATSRDQIYRYTTSSYNLYTSYTSPSIQALAKAGANPDFVRITAEASGAIRSSSAEIRVFSGGFPQNIRSWFGVGRALYRSWLEVGADNEQNGVLKMANYCSLCSQFFLFRLFNCFS